jgi:hypothetical protein
MEAREGSMVLMGTRDVVYGGSLFAARAPAAARIWKAAVFIAREPGVSSVNAQVTNVVSNSSLEDGGFKVYIFS